MGNGNEAERLFRFRCGCCHSLRVNIPLRDLDGVNGIGEHVESALITCEQALRQLNGVN